jgi:RHS repeat-associated protein
VEAVTRTVWNGDQVLAEIRAPIAAAEQDTGRAPAGTPYEYGYGQVLYTHGPALDRPLRVTRLSYDTIFPAPVWISPHTNWQGQYDSGEIVSSDGRGMCRNVSSGAYDNPPAGGAGSDGNTFPDSVWTCIQVDWPAPYQWRSHLEHGRGRIGPPSWVGSLIEGGRDLTGQMYMRNRFYDPASGRFTQEDPIGIAGGLNVYGFGNGDPVMYSDPYGLCPYSGGKGERDSRTKDCPNDKVGDAVRTIDQYGGKDGRRVVKAIAAGSLNPVAVDAATLSLECGDGTVACQQPNGNLVILDSDMSLLAARIVHETGHADIPDTSPWGPQYKFEEPLVRTRELEFWGRLPTSMRRNPGEEGAYKFLRDAPEEWRKNAASRACERVHRLNGVCR